MNQQVMAGTLLPGQMDTKAIIDALRQQPQSQQPLMTQQDQVVSAHPTDDSGQSMYDAMGRLIGKGVSYVGNNLGTALRYDTNPFSQQTNMLAAQDAAFR